MARDSYRDLRCPADTGRPLREELARLVYRFDAVAGADRTRRDYLHVADHVLEFIARRAVHTGDDPSGGVNRPPVAVNAFWRVRPRRQYVPPGRASEGETMSGRGTLWALRIAMWVLIVAAVPVYVVWLVRVGYLTGQHRLPAGDVIRWALPTLVPAAAVVLCVLVGATWWMSVVDRTASPLRDRWPVTVLVFIAAVSVLCGVASVDHPDVSAGLLSLVITGLGMAGLFFIPAARSRELPDVVRRRSASSSDDPAA